MNSDHERDGLFTPAARSGGSSQSDDRRPAADTLHGASDILVMLADMIWELSPDTTGKGICGAIEAMRFAVRYEADRLQSGASADAQTAEQWTCEMFDRPVENVRTNLILMLLAADANAHGKANASPAPLALRAGMSEANTLTALRWLERSKLIALEDEPAFTVILSA